MNCIDGCKIIRDARHHMQKEIDRLTSELEAARKVVEISVVNPWSHGEYTDWYGCPECRGTKIADGSDYCPSCGARIEWR
jgi:rubrerythrin